MSSQSSGGDSMDEGQAWDSFWKGCDDLRAALRKRDMELTVTWKYVAKKSSVKGPKIVEGVNRRSQVSEGSKDV